MENIFYATLALHIADKPINKENIKAVLKAAGAPVNEPALEAMAAFVESLESARVEKEKAIDPRIVKFLSSELAQHKVQTQQIGALLGELTKSIPSAREAHEAILPEVKTPAVSEKVHREEALREKVEAAMEVPVEEFAAMAQDKGRYVYGIAASKEAVRLGEIGIEGNEVYTIPYQDLCAIVHNCPTQPYQSKDEEIVKSWARAHQSVLDEVKERFSTTIPLGFDTILQPKDDATPPDQVVRDWLKEDYDRLRTLMEKIEGKDEYGVQVSYEPGVMGKQISEQSEEIKKMKEEMATKSPGMAYMYKQKLEKTVKAEMEKLADEWFKEFYGRIKQHTDDIVVERTKKVDKDRMMLLNLSCLVDKEKVEGLGEELEKINGLEGFSVRFTGPWPPYSFVAKPVAEGE
ncbi:MAG TPA: GvpL/GvpF family gas vesicle protein [Dehalococcoidia bacterium]|nr:GvpL/GvpF family gas vesicle protein [Dehalococcoidia bacterium]